MVTLDTATVYDITTRAKEIHFGRTMLAVLATMFFVVGWLTARTFGVAWLAVAWVSVAVKVGWVEGRKGMRAGKADQRR